VVSFTPRPLYSEGKSPWFPLDRRLGGPQSRSGRVVKRKIPSPHRESNPKLIKINFVSQGSSDSIVTRLRAGLPDLNSRQEKCFSFLFAAASRPALGLTQSSIQWAPWSLFPGIKRPGRGADHSPPSSGEVRNVWSCTYTHPCLFVAWCLIEALQVT
jgi:hypothetical protein